MHLVTSSRTKIPIATYEHYPGFGTMADVIGPLELDPIDALQMIPKEDRAKWWGRHLVCAGGVDDDDEDNVVDDGDGEAEDVAAPVGPDSEQAQPDTDGLVPTTAHSLPDLLTLDVLKAHNVKHMIDLTPCSPALVVRLVEAGISYWGLCASQYMKEHLDNWIEAGLLAALKDPQNPLYDRRLGVGDGANTEAMPESAAAKAVPSPAPKPKAKGKSKAKAKVKADEPPSTPLDLHTLLKKARSSLGDIGGDNGGETGGMEAGDEDNDE